MEYEDLTKSMEGCFIDLMSGEYIINVFGAKILGAMPTRAMRESSPAAFRKPPKLSQHISFLKDFFRSYKDFSDSQVDVIEIMLGKLYEQWDIHDRTDFDQLQPTDYPILSDLYDYIEKEFETFQEDKREIYTKQQLQEILLGLHFHLPRRRK